MKIKESRRKHPERRQEDVDRNIELYETKAGEKSREVKPKIGKYTSHLLSITIILATGIIIYSNSFNCSFHFDDSNVIDLTRGSERLGDWIDLYPGRPVSISTFFLNYHFHKLNVWGYHFVNLVIHLVNALLIRWLTLLTLSTPAMHSVAISRHRTVIAFLTGLLFVSHPLATQSVTYIVQRFASLATMFYLFSLALYIRGRLKQSNAITSYILFGASIICAVLGMLSKEMVFTLPFAIILYEVFFLKTEAWKAEAGKTIIPVFLIIFGMFIIIFFRNYSLDIFNRVPPGQGYHYSISAKDYLFTQFSVIITYLKLFFFPINLNLDYDYPVSNSLFEMKTLFSLVLLLGIALAGILSIKRYRLISFGIFWFFLTLSVESSILPISQNVIFEHRTYLPSFGFFLVLVTTPFYFVQEKYLKIGMVALLVVATINSVLTFQRNYIWKNEYTLWTDILKKSPNKARAWNNMGKALIDMNNHIEAIPYLDKAIELNPKYAAAYHNRAKARVKLLIYEGAISDYKKIIHLAANDADLFYYLDIYNTELGTIYGMSGKTDEAIRSFQDALSHNPNIEKVHYNLGVLLLGKNKSDEALKHFKRSMHLNPRREKVRLIAGSILVKQGKISDAVTLFKDELSIRPNNVEAYNDLGSAYYIQGKLENAVACYLKALQLDKKHTLASKNLDIVQKKIRKSEITSSCP